MILLIDIDGVLADNSHRLHYMRKKNFRKFYDNDEVLKDAPIEHGFMLLESLYSTNTHFVTGRAEICRWGTEEWLRRNLSAHGLGFDESKLHMRTANDYTPAKDVKAAMVRDILRDSPSSVLFDDSCSERGFFIDDDPNNVVFIEQKFENIKGLVFGTGRIDELKKKDVNWTVM